MDFQYKEHFSSVKVFINSFPASAITGVSVKTLGVNRNAYSLGDDISADVVPVSRGYEITLTRQPAPQDEFSVPESGFTLGIMDASSHTIYRGCAVKESSFSYSGGKLTALTIISNEKWEFKNYEYFGGAKCTAQI